MEQWREEYSHRQRLSFYCRQRTKPDSPVSGVTTSCTRMVKVLLSPGKELSLTHLLLGSLTSCPRITKTTTTHQCLRFCCHLAKILAWLTSSLKGRPKYCTLEKSSLSLGKTKLCLGTCLDGKNRALLSLNFANENPNVPEKKIMCREEDKQTLEMNRFIWQTTDYKETVQS